MNGQITFLVKKWSTSERKSVIHKTETQPCRKTPKRFIVVRNHERFMFDHTGQHVNRGLRGIVTYTYVVLPETFVEHSG